MRKLTKKCTKCCKKRQVRFFDLDRSKKDGLYPSCKTCRYALYSTPEALAAARERDRRYWKNPEVRSKLNQRQKIRTRRDRQTRYDFVRDFLLQNPCVVCGEKDPLHLECDHIDPTTKKYNISTMIANHKSIKEIGEELKKVQVLCRSHHRLKTLQEYADRKRTRVCVYGGKVCSTCKGRFTLRSFTYRKGRRAARCKECDYQRHLQYGEKYRAAVLEYNRSGCVDCGEKDSRLLENDHVTGTKVTTISQIVTRIRDMEMLKSELKNTVTRCIKCHTIKTAHQMNHHYFRKEE